GSNETGLSKVSSFDGSKSLVLRGQHDDDDSEMDEEHLEMMEQAGYAEEQEAEREKQERKERADVPAFLKQEKERLVREGAALGYDKYIITRTIRDGIAAATLEVLVDNIMNAGYGKSMTYKEAAVEAIPDDEPDLSPKSRSVTTLPGQMIMTLPGQPLGQSQILGADRLTLESMSRHTKDTTANESESQRMNLLTVGGQSRRNTKLTDQGRPLSPSSVVSPPTVSRKGSLPLSDHGPIDYLAEGPWDRARVYDGTASR
ncbi:unnamed protein product, partial [Polarella glacialis]